MLAYLAARTLEQDWPVLSTSVIAFMQLLISPVTWGHHWVWVLVILISLWEVRGDFLVALPVFAVGVITLTIPAAKGVPGRWMFGVMWGMTAFIVLLWSSRGLRPGKR